METLNRLLSAKQVNSLFKRRIAAYKRANERELCSFDSIPFGYGMRASHRLKTFPNKTAEIRDNLQQMVRDYPIDSNLLSEAVRERILSDDFVNKHQGTHFKISY